MTPHVDRVIDDQTVDVRLLSLIFPFRHLPADNAQSSTEIVALSALLCRFARTLEDDQERAILSWATGVLMDRGEGRSLRVEWFGEYGCGAIMEDSSSSSQVFPICTHITLISLDAWRFCVHTGAGGRQFTSHSDMYEVLHVGEVADPVEFLALFSKNLADAQHERKGDKRSAASNIQGHQRTPAFIFAVMRDAIKELAGNGRTHMPPPGGFTDVGLHTGGRARPTSWGLVRYVARALLCQHSKDDPVAAEVTFDFKLAEFQLWLLERYLTCPSNTGNSKRDIEDVGMEMLCTVTREFGFLADKGFDIEVYEVRCIQARNTIDELACHARKDSWLSMKLPDMNVSKPRTHNIILQIPMDVVPTATKERITGSAVRDLAAKNLGQLHILEDRRDSVSALLSWTKTLPKEPMALSLQLLLSTVDDVFYELVGTVGRNLTREKSFISCIEEIIDIYRSRMDTFQGLVTGSGHMVVELRSRELLCVYIAFCLVHDAVQTGQPLLQRYGVALRWMDLRHLVLGDQRAWDAAHKVQIYLQAKDSQSSQPLFSLRCPVSTFYFAEEYGRSDSSLQEVWSKEKAEAAERQDKHFNEVKEKQRRARVIRQEISELELTISLLEAERATKDAELAEVAYGTQFSATRLWLHREKDGLSREITQEGLKLGNAQTRLKEAEKAPPPVFQPLPRNESLAMRMIFFIYMPNDLRTLSWLSFSGQQMLVPKGKWHSPHANSSAQELSVDVLAVDNPKTILNEHYASCKSYGSDECRRSALRLDLGSKGKVPDWHGPRLVDECTSASDGIWHPDGLCNDSLIGMFWSGAGFALDQLTCKTSYWDPFLLDRYPVPVSCSFTETLPKEFASMQWALWQPGTADVSATRSNRAIASQEDIPLWLNKPQYITFGSLRAYCNQQVRKVCGVLHKKSLPLTHPAVHLLIKQALYHVGEFSGDEGRPWIWKVDQVTEGWSSVLNVELKKLAEELANTPRERSALRLVAELSAFVSQWTVSGRDLARYVASAAENLAQGLEIEIDELRNQEGEDNAGVCTLRAKQCLFFMYALLCHAFGNIQKGDIAGICRLSVLINSAQFFEDKSDYDKEMDSLNLLCSHILSKRARDIAKGIEDSMLTAAVREVIEDAPDSITWNSLGGCSYEAETEEGDLLSINVLNGVVLFNGVPPRRLPDNVLQHPLYKKAFGDRNFETVITAGGEGSSVIRTARAIRGKFYEFRMGPSATANSFRILEIDKVSRVILELLDNVSANPAWQGNLPVRLCRMHGHWLWRSKGIVVLRGISFLDQNISFMLKRVLATSGDTTSDSWKCVRVPDYINKQHGLFSIERLLDQESFRPDELVHLDWPDQLLDVFAKMEAPEFIEFYETSESGGYKGFKVCLPRYALGFQLEANGVLNSLDFSNFFLPKDQQLSDCLHGFDRYLILLQHVSGERKLILPQGKVVLDASGKVDIVGSEACDAVRHIYPYDFHARLGYLIPTSIAARLHLACLFAASDVMLPDLRHGKRGAEIAMELVRQSWLNRPLKPEEKQSLLNLKEFLSHFFSPFIVVFRIGIEYCAAGVLAPDPRGYWWQKGFTRRLFCGD